MHFRRRSGFTLIELLIVVAIIGLLVTVLVAVLLGAFTKGKEAECRNFLDRAMPEALNTWQQATGKKDSRFPSSGDNKDDTIGNILLYQELVTAPGLAGKEPYVPSALTVTGDEKGKPMFLDPWGTPYKYRDWSSPPPKGSKDKPDESKAYNPGRYDLVSAGPDKEFNTADDMINGGHSPKVGGK